MEAAKPPLIDPIYMPLYHRDAYGLPKLKIGTIDGVILSYHAQQQALTKGINVKLLDLSTFIPAEWDMIEIEVIGGIPVKLVARREFTPTEDLIIVILRKERLIKTCWCCHKDDKHSTLDKSPYSRP